jgi:hypothetical protein
MERLAILHHTVTDLQDLDVAGIAIDCESDDVHRAE